MARLVLKQFQGGGLEPLDLTIDPGECVTLTGQSGSGKTRLLRAIADLDPNHGDAWVGDCLLRETAPPKWRRQVGLLPAESHWWHDRVGDHFTRPAAGLLAALGLGEETLDWQVARLSSGERQRLALARLLDRQPSALLLDEPTANLDPENIARVEQVLAEYAQRQGAALFWVSHDPAQRKRVAQRRLAIHEHRIDAEDGA